MTLVSKNGVEVRVVVRVGIRVSVSSLYRQAPHFLQIRAKKILHIRAN